MKSPNFLPIAFLAALAGFTLPAAADDVAAGERVFKRCMACHAVGEGAKNRVGPYLNGIVDNEIASVEGYSYSKAFLEKKEEGFVWTEEALDHYLLKPNAAIKGTKMAFAGLPKAEDRANVIAYLKTFE
jgi:cytochrome c2